MLAHTEGGLDAALAALHDALQAEPAWHAHVLVDGALLDTQPDAVRESWPSFAAASLLGAATDDARVVGPLLFDWREPGAHAQGPAIPWAAASVIVSPLALDALAAHLMPLTEVRLEQMEDAMVMRFFDPRVLPFWLAALPPDYRSYLASGVSGWLYRDAALQWRGVPIRATRAAPATAFPLALTQAAEDSLLADCYPYTVLERLRGEHGALLARLPESTHYAFVREQLERCAAHGADGGAAQLIYCELALRHGPRFDEHPEFGPVWAALETGLRLPEALVRVSDEGWSRIQADATTPAAPHDFS